MYYPSWFVEALNGDVWVFAQVAALLLALLIFLDQFRRSLVSDRRDLLHLAALLAVTVGLRWYFYNPVVYEHTHFTAIERLPRVIVLLSVAADHLVGVAFSPYRGAFGLNMALAALSPLLIALHTELIFGRKAMSWFSAWLLACHPMHIKLSSTEAPVISSLFLGALVFVLFHLTVKRSDWRVQAPTGLVMLLVLPTFLLTRPLNFLSFPVLYVFAVLYRRDVRAQPAVWAFLAALLAINLGFIRVLDSSTQMLSPRHSVQILHSFKRLFFSEHNVLFNPWVVSWPGLALLALGTAVFAASMPEGMALVALWYLGTMAVTSIALSETVVGNSKYFLQLIYPLIIMSAHAVRIIRWPWMWAPAMALVLSMPWLSASYIRKDLDYQYEYRLVARAARRLRPGDQVLEIPLAVNRQGERVRSYYERYLHWGEAPSPRGPSFVDDPARVDLARRDVYFFCGLECDAQRALGRPASAPYDAVFDRFEMQPVMQTARWREVFMFFTSGLSMDVNAHDFERNHPVMRVTLYRVRGLRARAPGTR
jgi:hypothetical protein